MGALSSTSLTQRIYKVYTIVYLKPYGRLVVVFEESPRKPLACLKKIY